MQRPRKDPPAVLRRPRLGKAATAEKLAAERALVLSRQTVSRETVCRLDAYVELLRAWQARINLIAPSTVPEIWSRHVEEGLVLARLGRAHRRWVDLGSGAGLPGIVLAIHQAEQDGGHVDLIESNGKKAAFLRAVIRELSLPATVHAERAENLAPVIAAAEAVSARALASLDRLFELVGESLSPQAVCFFAKGREHDREIADASAHWRFDMVKHFTRTEAGSVILEITNLARNDPSRS